MGVITLPSGATVELADHAPLKMREFRAWMQAEAAGDFELVYDYLIRFVKAWSFDLPIEAASLDEITFSDYRVLNRSVSESILQSAAAKN